MYAVFMKRTLDFTLSLAALILLLPVLLVLTLIGGVAMRGNPFFTQPRPGKKNARGQERIFQLIKFRTMSNARDSEGKLLPDDLRLNRYGRFLRTTSLDELPELLNIVVGDMSIVGPRPQLVRDMVFMSKEQRRRHDVLPGLTGLAQVNGRNSISWEEKFQWDLKYIDDGITFFGDLKIIGMTVFKVLQHSGITRAGTASDLDFGDYLLQKGVVSEKAYHEKQQEAKQLLSI